MCELKRLQQHSFIVVVSLHVCLFVFNTAGFEKAVQVFPQLGRVCNISSKFLWLETKSRARIFVTLLALVALIGQTRNFASVNWELTLKA